MRDPKTKKRWPGAAGLMASVCLAGALGLGLTAWGQPHAAAAPSGAGEAELWPYVVAVDPGHGGEDVGAVGLGFYEKEMTLATARELTALLEADTRFTPFLTRPEDMTMNTRARSALANLVRADLMLSIHGNADPVSGATGFECYPAPPGRTFHAESLRFAGLLAEQYAAAGAELRGEGGVRYLYYDENDEKQFVEASDTTIHSERSFGVLERSHCPAVLAEQCFVTAPTDVAAFAGEEGCRTAARLYYQAICAYFELEPLPASGT